MEITEHAIDNYISRIIGADPHQTGETIRKRATDKIRDTVNKPGRVHKRSGEKVPVYIKGDIAVPVGKDPGGELYVPTTYHSRTFSEDESTNERAKA